MDGEVIYFDTDRGIGFIAGRDGNRYVFDRTDLSGAERIGKGSKVDFDPRGDRAQAVRPLGLARDRAVRSVPAAAGAAEGIAPAPFPEVSEGGPPPGIADYILRCLTSRYFAFGGRARRREFWSFALFTIPATLVPGFVALVIDFMAGNMHETAGDADFQASGAPVFMIATMALIGLGLVIPMFAVTIRRIHDIGLSGWFLLLNFIPSVGSLIILVFMLIPSQRHPNKWGQVPAGIRV